jgi:hypothetical protein
MYVYRDFAFFAVGKYPSANWSIHCLTSIVSVVFHRPIYLYLLVF